MWNFESPWYYWWAAWVSIPAPEDQKATEFIILYSLNSESPILHRVLRSVRSVRSVTIEKC